MFQGRPFTKMSSIVAVNELFRCHGYKGTSLSKISEASGATVGPIYHFFPGGNEALGVAVIETTGSIYRELFEAIMADSADPADAFRQFFAATATTPEESGECHRGRASLEAMGQGVPRGEKASTRLLLSTRQHDGRQQRSSVPPQSLR